jgi:hypothetical protein
LRTPLFVQGTLLLVAVFQNFPSLILSDALIGCRLPAIVEVACRRSALHALVTAAAKLNGLFFFLEADLRKPSRCSQLCPRREIRKTASAYASTNAVL